MQLPVISNFVRREPGLNFQYMYSHIGGPASRRLSTVTERATWNDLVNISFKVLSFYHLDNVNTRFPGLLLAVVGFL